MIPESHEPKKRNLGAMKWCKHCSRRHRTRERCLLVAYQVPSRAGDLVTRLINVDRLQLEGTK